MDAATRPRSTGSPGLPEGVRLRREIEPGDYGRIIEMHGRLYTPVYGLSSEFEGHVARSVATAAIAGFPREREQVRLVEDKRDGRLLGSVALTDDGAGVAVLRWVLLEPELRGHGLGRRLIADTVDEARAANYRRIWLETFADLVEAASIYTSLGFRLVSEDTSPRWGREQFSYRRYELELG